MNGIFCVGIDPLYFDRSHLKKKLNLPRMGNGNL